MKFSLATFKARMIQRQGRERWNEHVKLLASAVSALGVACLIGGFVAPMVNPIPANAVAIPLLVGAGAVFHMVAQIILHYYQGKE